MYRLFLKNKIETDFLFISVFCFGFLPNFWLKIRDVPFFFLLLTFQKNVDFGICLGQENTAVQHFYHFSKLN